MLINCRMRTTSPQTQVLLKASLGCRSFKTTKQWSKWSSKAEVQRWDTCQEPTELRLLEYLIDSIWTLRSISNMLTPRTNSRTHWPKVVLHVMNVTIFFVCSTSWILDVSCSHFLSNRKQSVMSKRVQESTAKEGSVVAKPRPMSLVSRNLLSAKKIPPKDWSASNSQGNQELDQHFVTSSAKKLVRNNNQDPTEYSQDRRQDDSVSSGTRKLVRSGESASSASTRKPVRGDDNQSKGQGWHSTKCTSPTIDTLEQVFKNLLQKLNLAEEAPTLDLKANVLIWKLFMSTKMKASVHLGPNYNEILKVYRNTDFEELNNLFDITRGWCWNMKPIFWMYHRLIWQLPHGWDLRFCTIK